MRAILLWLLKHFNLLKIIRSLPDMSNNIDFEVSAEVLSKLDTNKLRIIYELGQKKLEYVYHQGDIMYNRSLTIASVIIASISALSGYLLTNDANVFVLISSILTIGILCYTAVTIKPNLIPTKYNSPGCEPKFLVEDYIYNQDIEGKDDEWKLLYNQVVNTQSQINCNITNNKNRSDNIKDVMHAVYAIPAILIMTFIVSFIFSLLL